MSSSIEFIESNYPLHYYVWNNEVKKLKQILDCENGKLLLEKFDPRGRTPLMLAVSLGHFECTKILLNANADVNVDDKSGFNVLHEAIATNDPELVQLVLEKRDLQRNNKRSRLIPSLLCKINDTPDFYVEMKWEFASWIPLVSKVCPSDVYKIYKSGSSVRIDTTLCGFEQMSWQRGSRTYIFNASENGAKFVDIDHDNRQVHIENMILSELTEPINLFTSTPDVFAQARLTCPTTITYVDTENISFERSKSGIIGFRIDRTDIINNYECKVFTTNNVQLVSKTRTEHLTEQDKQNYKEQLSSNSFPLHSLLGSSETIKNTGSTFNDSINFQSNSNPSVNLVDYFSLDPSCKNADIGRPKEITTKINKFKAHLWLSEQFPLSLQEQILPIIDLMAVYSSHFAKLRDFITLRIPAGFPVKIEIPLFHVVNARISFGNVFSICDKVEGVTLINDETTTACVIDESVFKIPVNYSYLGNDDLFNTRNVDNEVNQVFLFEESKNSDTEMQRAIQQSLEDFYKNQIKNNFSKCRNENYKNIETGELINLAESNLSENNLDTQNQLIEDDDAVFEKVLKLSLKEK